MSRYTDKFDEICGDCAGIDMRTITEEDVRALAKIWAEEGETITEDDIGGRNSLSPGVSGEIAIALKI